MTKEYNPLEHSVVQALLKPDATHRYECDDFIEALVFGLRRELERCYWNWNQERLEDREDWQLDTGTGFEYRRYFWGDCDCGADSPVHANNCRTISEREDWVRRRLNETSEPTKGSFFSEVRFDKFEEWEKTNPFPPCTCGAESEWQEREYHLPTCSPGLPNLKFGGVIINWYKHIGRGMSVNVNWNEKRWREWFDAAMKAIRLYDSCMQAGHRKFRDEDAGRKPFKIHEKVQSKDCIYCVSFGANSVIWNRQGSIDVEDAE